MLSFRTFRHRYTAPVPVLRYKRRHLSSGSASVHTSISISRSMVTATTQTPVDVWDVHAYSTLALNNTSDFKAAVNRTMDALLIRTDHHNNDNTGGNLLVVVNNIPQGEETIQLMINKASLKDAGWKYHSRELVQKYRSLAEEVLIECSKEYCVFLEELYADLRNVNDILDAICLTGSAAEFGDVVMSYGEAWSARIFMMACIKRQDISRSQHQHQHQYRDCVYYMDTREIISTEEGFKNKQNVSYPTSDSNLRNWFTQRKIEMNAGSILIVATGKIASTLYGHVCRMDRLRDIFFWDSVAAILSTLMRARCITIWSNVDGIYSIDEPCADAKLVKHMSGADARTLAFFSTSTSTSLSMSPQLVNGVISSMLLQNRYNTPIVVRNTRRLDCPGTRIDNSNVVSGITCLSCTRSYGVCIVHIYTRSDVQSSIVSTVCTALHEHRIQLIMICNGISGFSLSIVVKDSDAIILRSNIIIENALSGTEVEVEFETNCSIISAIGNIDDTIFDTIIGTMQATSHKCKGYLRSNNNVSMVVHKDLARECATALHKAIVVQ